MAHSHPASPCCRRDFLKGTLSCGAYTLAALAASSTATRKAFAQPTTETALTAPFAGIEKIADGVWAVISTPFKDLSTISNGGIVAGDDAVLVIEGFQTTKGAAWLRDACKQLTGRYPTHVALTHYHPDHSNGIAGFMGGADVPEVVSTWGTRDWLLRYLEQETSTNEKGADGLTPMDNRYVIPNRLLYDKDGEAKLDLGGRTVTLHARVGHTPSDMTISVDDPKVVFCSDLLFNGLFPNYMDAVPTQLGPTCRALLGDSETTYIPGHGSIANAAAITNYLGVLDAVEAAAREGLGAGKSPAEIAAEFKLPPSLGPWFIYDPHLYQNAFEAWRVDLESGAG